MQEYYLVALSQPRSERLAELHLDSNGKSLAAKMVGCLALLQCIPVVLNGLWHTDPCHVVSTLLT